MNWQKRKQPYLSVRIVAMSLQNISGSVRVVGRGIRWLKKNYLINLIVEVA